MKVYEKVVRGNFSKEEFANIVHQILEDNEFVGYINVSSDKIEFSVTEFNNE